MDHTLTRKSLRSVGGREGGREMAFSGLLPRRVERKTLSLLQLVIVSKKIIRFRNSKLWLMASLCFVGSQIRSFRLAKASSQQWSRWEKSLGRRSTGSGSASVRCSLTILLDFTRSFTRMALRRLRV